MPTFAKNARVWVGCFVQKVVAEITNRYDVIIMQKIVSPHQSPLRKLGSLFLVCALLAGAGTAQADKQADDARLAANGLFKLTLYAQAIKEYEAFLKKWPNDPHAVKVQYGLGAAHFNLKQYDKAEAVMGKVVGNPKCPDVPRANFIWGQSLLMIKKPANAEGAFDAALKALAPKTPADRALQTSLQTMRLESLYAQQKWKDVVSAAKALKGKAGNRAVRVAFQGAFAMYNLEQFAEASTEFTSLKAGVKGTALAQQTHFLLGECLRKQNKQDAAIAEFLVAANLKGNDAPQALFRAAFLQFQLKKFGDAEKNFEDFRVKFRGQVGPELFNDARIFLGRCQMELKQFNRAEKVFADLAKEPKAPAKVFLWQGRMFQGQKKFTEAVGVLDAALKKFANDELRPDLLFDFANNNLGLEKFKEAGDTFDTLRKEQPKFKEMAVLLHLNAVCKHNTKDFKTSLQLCGDFLKDHADHDRAADVAYLECENHFFLDDHKNAIAGFNKFVAANAAHPKANLAKMRIGQSEYSLKQWPNVLKALEPLLAAAPKGREFDQLEFLVGESYYRQENWAKAAEICLAFTEAKPKSTNADTALLMTGLANEKLDKKAEAIAAFQKLEKDYPESAQIAAGCVQLGILLYEDKKFVEAKSALAKVAGLAKHELKPKAQYFLAWVEVGQAKPADAAKLFGALADANPQHTLAADARLQQGMMLFKAEQFPEAQAALMKFIADNAGLKENDVATYHIGASQKEQEDWAGALASFAKVDAKSDWKDDALYQSAWCERGAGKKEAAAPHYTALLKDFPESPLANNATLELAEINFEAKNLDDVVKDLQAMIAKKPKAKLLAGAQYRLGWALFEQKKFADGAKAFEAMLPNADPAVLVTAAWQAGECRWNIKEFPLALANYQKAVAAKKPEEKEQAVLQEQALLRVGQCQDQLGQWPVAEASFKKFIGAHPKHDQIRAAQYGFAKALKSQKKYDEALAAFAPVLEEGIRDELGAQAQFLVGECHLEQEEFDKAIAEYVKVEINYAFPDWQSKAVFEMAVALSRKGEAGKAKAQYERLIAKFPDTEAAKAAKAKLN